MKIILSPCLYMNEPQVYNLLPLEETLEFTDRFLEASLDLYDNAFYSKERFYAPPVCEYNNSFLYGKIRSIIYNLLEKGEIIQITEKADFEIKSRSYNIVDKDEFQIICNYLNKLYKSNNLKEIVMFVRNENYDVLLKHIEIELCNSYPIFIPISKNPWLEETDVLNQYIKCNDSSKRKVFPNSETCAKLVEKMCQEKKEQLGNSKSSVYKKYGAIIALRNGYSRYYPTNPFNVQTYYYKSSDRKYIISIDLLHGNIEVFDGKSELWFAEYNFLGTSVYEPITQKEINEARQNHKVNK